MLVGHENPDGMGQSLKMVAFGGNVPSPTTETDCQFAPSFLGMLLNEQLENITRVGSMQRELARPLAWFCESTRS